MSQETKTSSGGIGFCGLLGIVFITLKLCHVIDWSWWWVTLPLWGGAVFGFGMLAGLLLMAGITLLVALCLPKRKTHLAHNKNELRRELGANLYDR